MTPVIRPRATITAAQLLDLLQPALSCHTPAGVSKQLRSCALILADHSVARSDAIELKFRRLPGGDQTINLREESCEAWSPKARPTRH